MSGMKNITEKDEDKSKNATQGKTRFCRGMRGVNVVAAAES